MPALLLALVWVALVGLFAGQFVVAGALEWEESLSRATSFWLPWLPLLPLTYWLSRMLLRRGTRPLISVLLHLAGCVAVVIACQSYTPDRPPQFAGREPPAPPQEGGIRHEGPMRPPGRGEGGGPPWAGGQRPGNPRPDSGRPRGMFGPFGFRSIIDIVVYGGVVSLTHAIAFLRRSRQRERRTLELEASLSCARLDALRLQINPHFLFNTLNAISALIHTRPDTADEMTGNLSELLRASLQGSSEHEVPLREEMELLRLFTDIERTRFGDRIAFKEDVEPDALAAKVPSLILQPLVENAIRHGLEPRVDRGTVTVAARREGESLHLTVSDDGVGFTGNEHAAGDGPGGIGLTNTRDRLQALYGDAHSLTIAPGPAGGTVVGITIPFRTA